MIKIQANKPQLVTLNRLNWTKHKLYYDSGANKFINIHNYIRQEIDRILKLITAKNFKRAHYLFLMLHDLLDMHHKVEEKNLFPYLEKLKLLEESKGLGKDHEIMNETLSTLANQFKDSKKDGYESLQSELLDTFTTFKINMYKHLQDEEDITIPVIILGGFRFSCCTNESKVTCCFY